MALVAHQRTRGRPREHFPTHADWTFFAIADGGRLVPQRLPPELPPSPQLLQHAVRTSVVARVMAGSTSEASRIPDSEKAMDLLQANGSLDRLRMQAIVALEHDVRWRRWQPPQANLPAASLRPHPRASMPTRTGLLPRLSTLNPSSAAAAPFPSCTAGGSAAKHQASSDGEQGAGTFFSGRQAQH